MWHTQILSLNLNLGPIENEVRVAIIFELLSSILELFYDKKATENFIQSHWHAMAGQTDHD